MTANYDVLLGLVLLYAVFSAAASMLVEWWSGYTGRRARFLRDALSGLLGSTLGEAVWHHPLVRGEAGTRSPSAPSYIDADTFAVVLLDLAFMIDPPTGRDQQIAVREALELPSKISPGDVRCNGCRQSRPIDPRGLRILRSLTVNARSAVEVHDRIHVWFKAAMQRVSGIYKRRSQVAIAGASLFLVGAFNVDTIRAWRVLASMPAARDGLLAAARVSPAQLTGVLQKGAVALPFGWSGQDDLTLMHLGGLLLTWFAIVAGGPLWFDLVDKLINPRQAGGKNSATRIVAQ